VGLISLFFLRLLISKIGISYKLYLKLPLNNILSFIKGQYSIPSPSYNPL